MRKLKICIISHDYPPFKEGMGYAVHRIAKMLSREFEIHVVTRLKDDSLPDSIKMEPENDGNIIIHRVFNKGFIRRYYSPLEIQKILFFLIKLHEKYSFDIFHGFGIFPCGFISTILSNQTGVRNIVSVRGDDGEIGVLDYRFRDTIIWTLENAGFITFVSEAARRKVECFIGCRQKSAVIYNSLNPSLFFYNNKLKLDGGGIKIGIVGILREKKGFEYLMCAFSRIEKTVPDANLIVVGFFDDGYQPKFDYKPKNFKITGFIEQKNILNYIKQLDIVVLPSVSDGCPNTLLESMYCRKPVVASKVGAIDEIITHGENGLLVEPCSSEDLYIKIMSLISDKKLMKMIGENAYKTVINRFGIENEKKQWVSIYKRLRGM